MDADCRRLGLTPKFAGPAVPDDAKSPKSSTSRKVARGGIGYFTGLRLRDVAEMTWSSIDLVESLIRIKTGKTGAELTLPLHENLAAWLREHKQGLGKAKVFPELAGKGTGGRYGLSGRFKTIMEGAGISGRVTRTADGKGRTISSLSFHSLRHSFVSALANAGVTQDLRQKLSGHADDQTHYTHHDIANLRTAVAKLPNVVMA